MNLVLVVGGRFIQFALMRCVLVHCCTQHENMQMLVHVMLLLKVHLTCSKSRKPRKQNDAQSKAELAEDAKKYLISVDC